MKTFMFPGQGAQAVGMGADLFDQFPELTAKADEILGYSIKDLCLKDPTKELNQTQFTQPALFVVNALSYMQKIKETGEKPDYVIGHSLGELNALFAAGCFDFEVGLKLVRKRGELMSRATKGGMAAVLNSSEEEIRNTLEKAGLNNITLANFNTPSQIVISGLKDEITKAEPVFKKKKITIIILNTSGAFHSKYMAPAKDEFEALLKEFDYSGLKIPVIANRTAVPYENTKIIETLANQITSPVRWVESIRYLMGHENMEFEELGHGSAMTKLVKKIKDETPKELIKPIQGLSQNAPAPESPATTNEEVAEEVTPATNADESSDGAIGDQNPVGMSSEQSDEAGPEMVTVNKGSEALKLEAEEKVNAWNTKYPVGTKVKSMLFEDKVLETKTEAQILFGFRAAVYMEGYNGYFDLDEIEPYEATA